jgi:DNA-directed RNA polymerase subunit RPC12/RpoP
MISKGTKIKCPYCGHVLLTCTMNMPDTEYVYNAWKYFDGLTIVNTVPYKCPKCSAAIDFGELIQEVDHDNSI